MDSFGTSSLSLTGKELHYLTDTDFLLTKATIQRKADRLLAVTENQLKEYILQQAVTFPEAVLKKSGKISRGENYRGLPYQVLDYPRLLSTNDIFNLRTMVWWGNELSVTWHIAGDSFEQFCPTLAGQLLLLQSWGWQICISDDPWQYYRNPAYYRPASDFILTEWEEWLNQRSFCKFATFFPFPKWNSLPSQSVIFLDQVVTLLDL